ncbi:MFS transporter [Govanella unica]|uniref:MFS transporter n=1 Tax=Govanella unica TaxID=2975056 RepID=A0A9X3Z799_9PROT|nr:MFS transporter [Govania unica]MDA5193848.1 MFS transporter [Govania unica]
MEIYHRNIALLSLAQCLFTLTGFAHGVYTGLAGLMLAPTVGLATLPISIMILGTLIAAFPLSHFMRRHGRKAGFLVAVLAGIGCGALGYLALAERSFPLFCCAAFLQGIYQAGGQFYRFAAMELAPDHYRSRAVAYVLGGGVLAPILGPTLFAKANALFEPLTFAGAYITLILLGVLAMAVLSTIPFPRPVVEDHHSTPPRPLSVIMRQPVFIMAAAAAATGFGIMVLMMTGAPLAIIGCGFTVATAASAIQWHILGMFLPSFASGPLIARVGVVPVMVLGTFLFMAAGVTAWSGLEFANFRFSLLFVAVGWNFLYTAGTSMLADSYRPNEKAKVQAVNECLLFGASAITSLLAGILIEGIGWQAVAVTTICTALALLLLILGFTVSQKQQRTA